MLSPHLDDAVLSCWSVLGGATETAVLNLFAGVPPPGTALTSWDRATGATDARARALERIAEDREALGVAGTSGANLDFLSDQLWSASGGYWTPSAKLLNRIAPRVLATRRRRERLRQLTAAVNEHAARGVVVYAPAAIGGHADHLLAREVGIDLLRHGGAVRFYADQPYCTELGWPSWVTATSVGPSTDADAHWQRFLTDSEVDFSGLERSVERLGDDERQRKLSALRRYETQFAVLNARAGGALEDPDVIGWEVFWHADGWS